MDPSTDSGLQVVSCNGKGRTLHVTRNIKAGQLVLQQKPYAAVLNGAQVAERCDFCYEAKPDLLKCGRSKLARYCNRPHQKLGWDAGYKQECTALVATSLQGLPTPSPTMRLTARVLWRAIKERRSAPQNNDAATGGVHEGGTWYNVTCLEDHWDHMSSDMQLMFAQVAAAARQLALAGLSTQHAPQHANQRDTVEQSPDISLTKVNVFQQPWEDDGLPSVKAVAHLVGIFYCNSHTICDEELRPVGMGLYPLAAMANHSCNPSCQQSFVGDNICFRALRDLQPGDEVTISYIETAATLQQRREALCEQYCFDVCPSSAPPPPHAINTPPGSMAMTQNDSGSPHCRAGHIHSQQPTNSSSSIRPRPIEQLALQPDGSWASSSQGAQSLDGPSSHSAANSGNSSGPVDVTLNIYGLQNQPPWPFEDKDLLLTQLLVHQPAAPGDGSQCTSRSGGAASSLWQLLAGGVQAGMVSTSKSQVEDFFRDVHDHIDDAIRETIMSSVGDLSLRDPVSTTRMHVEHQKGGDQHQHATTTAASLSGPKAAASVAACQIDVWGPWCLATLSKDAQQQASLNGEEGVDVPAGVQGGVLLDANNVCLCTKSLAVQLTALLMQVQAAEQCSQQGQFTKAVTLLTDAVHTMDSFTVANPQKGRSPQSDSVKVKVGPYHMLRMQALAALMKAAIDSGDAWDVAMKAALALAPIYELVYPSVWPALCLHYAAVAKLAAFLEDSRAALTNAEKALKILSITHAGAWGTAGSALCQQIARIRWESEQDLVQQGQRVQRLS